MLDNIGHDDINLEQVNSQLASDKRNVFERLLVIVNITTKYKGYCKTIIIQVIKMFSISGGFSKCSSQVCFEYS